MRRILATIALAGALIVPATAPAHTPKNHTCRVPLGTVTASAYTSCAFADQIADAWTVGVNSGRCDPDTDDLCVGRVYSPVTHKTYKIVCEAQDVPVVCDATNGNDAWISFY